MTMWVVTKLILMRDMIKYLDYAVKDVSLVLCHWHTIFPKYHTKQ